MTGGMGIMNGWGGDADELRCVWGGGEGRGWRRRHSAYVGCMEGQCRLASACRSVLLENGASIEARDRYNDTALMVAAECGNSDCVELLSWEGANMIALGIVMARPH